jgi:protein associated with RNAse G/E
LIGWVAAVPLVDQRYEQAWHHLRVMSAAERRFEPGATAVRRDVFAGKVWTAAPFRVVRDHGDELVLTCWPGIESLAPATWTEWLRTGDEAVRKQALPDLAAGRWELERWIWRDTVLLTRLGAGEYFSVSQFFTPDGRAARWYVNFERPFRRTPIGIDTFDLLLDLVIAPDLSWHAWKDEDEYAQGRHLGLIDDTTHRHVDEGRQQVMALLEDRHGPFAEDWSGWSVAVDWPKPVLPPGVLEIPAGS